MSFFLADTHTDAAQRGPPPQPGLLTSVKTQAQSKNSGSTSPREVTRAAAACDAAVSLPERILQEAQAPAVGQWYNPWFG